MATMLYDAALLEQLRQMSGVVGSMLISSDGELISHSMPAQRSDALLAAAPRLSVLLEALSAGRPAESYSLRFASHRLLIRECLGLGPLIAAEASWPLLHRVIGCSSEDAIAAESAGGDGLQLARAFLKL